MKPFSAEEIKKIVNGTLTQGSADLIANQAAYYVEKMDCPNTLLFLRLTGHINWELINKYVPCTIVTDKNLEPLRTIENCTVIMVNNIESAFWEFVDYYRSLFQIPVIAVTGTCGKSTTKDMIKHILCCNWSVTGTKASANSRTHHLNYLLDINENTDVAVFETPVGKPGDITNSCRYFKPTIGIITNIGLDHMEGCKGLESYIKAKAEMLTGVDESGILIINADDENIQKFDLKTFRGRIVKFGINYPSDFQASHICYSEKGMNFTLTLSQMKHDIFIPGYGEHQVYNALAALSAVHQLGIGITEAAESLTTFKNLPSHIEVIDGINGSIIIDDTWNTNPNSLKAAIQVLTNISRGRTRIALIGDINALGDFALEIHRQIGDMLVESGGVDILITIGTLSAEAANQALKSGFKGDIYMFNNTEGIYDLLKNKLNSNTILLVKSSGYHDKTILDLVKKLKKM
jgi:UDP-N-acetylmuramoyl-tripeptide--D-alanyl-D-alanine ligase